MFLFFFFFLSFFLFLGMGSTRRGTTVVMRFFHRESSVTCQVTRSLLALHVSPLLFVFFHCLFFLTQKHTHTYTHIWHYYFTTNTNAGGIRSPMREHEHTNFSLTSLVRWYMKRTHSVIKGSSLKQNILQRTRSFCLVFLSLFLRTVIHHILDYSVVVFLVLLYTFYFMCNFTNFNHIG